MQETRIIGPSLITWSSPVALVMKDIGSAKCYADYRKLNQLGRKDAYPKSRTDGALDTPQQAQYVCLAGFKNRALKRSVVPSCQTKIRICNSL